jgi:hypothetical protein
MPIDLDTFLTTVYCIIDDWCQQHLVPQRAHRPGQRPELSDSEVLTLMVLAQWQAERSETAFLAYVGTHWRAYFPRLLSQSAFNRRARDLCGAVSQLGPTLAQHLAATQPGSAAYQVLDTVPVPLMRQCRGRRHRCFAAEADIGQGGSDDERYYGVQLLAVVDAGGWITGFVIGPASADDRWLAEALWRWRQDPTAPTPTAAEMAAVLGPSHRRGGGRRGPAGPLGPGLGVGTPDPGPQLGDLGLRGAAWRAHWRAAYGVTVLTKDDYDGLPAAEEARLDRWFCGWRQVVETVNGQLDAVFGLKFPRAHTYWGLLTRLGAKVAAHNLLLGINHLLDRPAFTHFNPLPA